MPTILAIDVGLVRLGVAVYDIDPDTIVLADIHETTKSPKKRNIRGADDDATRVADHARYLAGLIDKHTPRGAILEVPGGGARGARASRCMGLSTGLVVAVLTVKGIPAEYYSEADTKIAATGKRSATKDEVAAVVLKRWPNTAWPRNRKGKVIEDATDAAGLVFAAEHGEMLTILRGR